MEKLERRFGLIKLARSRTIEDIEFRRLLFKEFVPLRSILYDQYTEPYDKMVCYHKNFEILDPSVKILEYNIIINTLENGEVKFEFKKCTYEEI